MQRLEEVIAGGFGNCGVWVGAMLAAQEPMHGLEVSFCWGVPMLLVSGH